MQQKIGPILIVVGLIAIGAFLINKHSGRADAAESELAWTRIQRDYLERVGWIRSNPDEAGYKSEVNNFLGWYFKQVDGHMKRFGGNTEYDDYVKEREARGVPKLEEHKAHWAFVKGIFDAMKGGRYAPVFSGTDKGMRLDVVSSDVVMEGGKPMIRLVLALWGAQREIRDEGKGQKRMAASARFRVAFKAPRAAGKGGKAPAPYEAEIGGDPGKKIDHPERFIPQFPPQMVLGHYDIDLWPSDAEKMEITFNVDSTSPTGGNANATYVWKLDTPSDWKLAPGAAWEGASEVEREPEMPQ